MVADRESTPEGGNQPKNVPASPAAVPSAFGGRIGLACVPTAHSQTAHGTQDLSSHLGPRSHPFQRAGKPKQCPVCEIPATPKHIVWMRKWHKGRGHKPMPPEWAERLTQHDEEPLWNAGWIPLEPQDHLTIQHPYQGHGVWQGLQVLQSHQYQEWAFTLDATPSTYDQRSQLWVFHHRSARQPSDQNSSTDCWLGGPGQTHLHCSQGHSSSCCSLGSVVRSSTSSAIPRSVPRPD